MPFIAHYLFPHYVASDSLISITIIIQGVAGAFLQGGVFGFAAMFPPKMMGSVMLGQGLSGLVVNVVRIICLVILPPDQTAERGQDMNMFYGCLIYFAIASSMIIACIFLYFMLVKTDYAKFYMNKISMKEREERLSSISERAKLVDQEVRSDDFEINQTAHSGTTLDQEHNVPLVRGNVADDSFMGVYKRIIYFALQVFVCFTITFIVYPGVTL